MRTSVTEAGARRSIFRSRWERKGSVRLPPLILSSFICLFLLQVLLSLYCCAYSCSMFTIVSARCDAAYKKSFLVWGSGSGSDIVPTAASPAIPLPLPFILFASAADPFTTAEYQFRLVDGVTMFDGRLELKPFPIEPWGTICSNIFKESRNGPNAACRSLGFYDTTESYFVGFGRGDPTSPIWLDGVACTPNDKYLQNCTTKDLGDHNCGHGDDSGIRCVAPRSQWEFKLVNSTIPNRGLVLFRPYPFLPWGTVHVDAYAPRYEYTSILMRRAICRSMPGAPVIEYPIVAPGLAFGHANDGGATNVPAPPAIGNPNIAPTYLRSVQHSCGGNGSAPIKSYTRDCAHDGYISQFSWPKSEQLGLFCDHWEIHSTMEVRLVNGYSPTNGQVQYRPNAVSPWMYISFDALLMSQDINAVKNNVNAHNWRGLNAVCRQAGFTDVVNASFRFFGIWPVGGVKPPAQVATILCDPNARTLLECNLTRTYDLSKGVSAGVDCYPERTQGLAWSYRIHNATADKPARGVAQMRLGNGEWGSITTNETNNFGLWDAFCNMVGHPSGSTFAIRDFTPFVGNRVSWTLRDSEDMAPAYLSRVSCPLTVPNMATIGSYTHAGVNLKTDCTYEPLMNSYSVASQALVVDCDSGNIRDPTAWEVQINSKSRGNGLVQFRSRPEDQWGAVCSVDLNALAALCRMAGYGDSSYFEVRNYASTYIPAASFTAARNTTNYPMYLHNLRCPEGVSDLSLCTFDHFESETCHQNFIAGVDCYAVPNDPKLWQFRLADRGVMSEGTGRLDVKLAPWLEWGTICDSGNTWSQTTITAACQSLGYTIDPSNVVKPRKLLASNFITSTGAILLSNMQCASSIQYLQNCTSYTFMSNTCGHSTDVALECLPPQPRPPQPGGGGSGGGTPVVSEQQYRPVSVAPGENPDYVRIETRFTYLTDWGSIHAESKANDYTFLNLACQTVGYDPAKVRFARSLIGQYIDYSTRVIIGGYTCSSANTHLANCSKNWATYLMPNNIHAYDLVVNCSTMYDDKAQWQFRLVDGTSHSNGRLEVKPLPSVDWGTVCDDSFDSNPQTAIAACNSLGFNHTDRLLRAGAGAMAKPPRMALMGTFRAGAASTNIWLDDMNCPNSEYLQNCTSYTFVRHNCQHSEDVGLFCEYPLYNSADFEFRLVPLEPGVPYVGRVEMRPNATEPWGTIYQSIRDLEVVRTACRMFGFGDLYPSFGFNAPGTGAVYVVNYACPMGSESLKNCTTNVELFASQTSHGYDLVIECDAVVSTNKTFWEVKLVDGEHEKPHFGRVMFRPAPWTVWGSINGASGFNIDTAQAVCRSVGYTEENGFKDPINAQYTTNLAPRLTEGRVWLSSMSCPARPLRFLENCSSYGWRSSYTQNHAYDVWVDCYPRIQVRIVDGPEAWRGRIEIKYNNWTGPVTNPNNGWGTMCNDEFISNHFGWLAICRTAGFTNVTLARFEEWGEGPESQRINLDDFECDPNQHTAEECTFRQLGQHNCYHSEDSGINCYADPDDRSIWQYRFWGTGSTPTKGRVEMLPTPEDMWGMLCPTIINHTKHAWLTVCRTLGIETDRAVPMSFGPGYGPIYLDNINCSATDPTLRDCDSYPLNSYECTPQRPLASTATPRRWTSANGSSASTTQRLANRTPTPSRAAASSMEKRWRRPARCGSVSARPSRGALSATTTSCSSGPTRRVASPVTSAKPSASTAPSAAPSSTPPTARPSAPRCGGLLYFPT